MFSWNTQRIRIQQHDQLHTNPRNNIIPFGRRDPSCLICYPVRNPLTLRFRHFWDWFFTATNAAQFTQITIDNFNNLLVQQTDPARTHYIDNIVNSIRFQAFEQRDYLVNIILNCARYTNNFHFRVEDIRPAQNPDNYTNTTDTSESEDDDNMNLNQQMVQALQQVSASLNVRHTATMPLFSGGNQDPVEWLEEFERCAMINGYDNAFKLRVVGGYLVDESRQWFQRIYANGATQFNSWENVARRPKES